MPRTRTDDRFAPTPILRRLSNGSAGCSFSGRRVTCGPWDDRLNRPSHLAARVYSEVMSAWKANGMQSLDADEVARIKNGVKAENGKGPFAKFVAYGARPVGSRPAPAGLPDKTVGEVFEEFVRFKSEDGRSPISEAWLKNHQRLAEMYSRAFGSMPAIDFGPRQLEEAQRRFAEHGTLVWAAGDRKRQGLSYVTINRYVDFAIQAFDRATFLEWVPAGHGELLRHIPRYTSRSPGLVRPRAEQRKFNGVPNDIFEATLPHLPTDEHRAMLRLMRLTGMRPGEVYGMTMAELSIEGDVWHYEPSKHKTAHRGKTRIVSLGPRAQDVIRPYLRTERTVYLFSPQRAESERAARRRAERTCDPTASRSRDELRKAIGDRRNLAEQWHSTAVGRAVRRACDAAGVDRWSPNQLRHAAKNDIEALAGAGAVKAALGHSRLDTQRFYGDADRALADDVARKIG